MQTDRNTTANQHAPLTPWSQREALAAIRSNLVVASARQRELLPEQPALTGVRHRTWRRRPTAVRAADAIARYWLSGEPAFVIAARHGLTVDALRGLAHAAASDEQDLHPELATDAGAGAPRQPLGWPSRPTPTGGCGPLPLPVRAIGSTRHLPGPRPGAPTAELHPAPTDRPEGHPHHPGRPPRRVAGAVPHLERRFTAMTTHSLNELVGNGLCRAEAEYQAHISRIIRSSTPKETGDA